MSIGTRPGRKTQFGWEATPGTEVNATEVLRGVGMLADAREWVDAEEDLGLLPMSVAQLLVKNDSALEFEGPLTAEQLPVFLETGVDEVTPVQDGTGSQPWISTYTLPTDPASPGSPRAITLESGDEAGVDVAPYGRTLEWGISGDEAGMLQMTASLVGQGKATHSGGFTAGASIPDADRFRMGDTKLYLDAIGGTAGSTEKSDTLLAIGGITGRMGWQPYYSGGGGASFAGLVMRERPTLEIDVTFIHNSNARAEKDNYENGTPRLLQLTMEGAAVSVAGTTYSKKTVIVRAAGIWRDLREIDEQNGLAVLRGVFHGRYHSTPGYFGSVIVVNDRGALS